MEQFAIYRSPRDYPDQFVVRRWRLVGNEAVHDAQPLAVVDSLDEARAAVPLGLVRINRYPEDDPVIVEVWL